MFVRWKKRKELLTASLVKSVRVNGQPRHEIIAKLCSVRDKKEHHAGAWAQVEKQVQELHLSEQEQEQVYQSIEKKIPRPSPEEIEQAKQSSAGWDAWWEHYKANVVPATPPPRPNGPLQIDYPQMAIEWKVEQPRPKFGVDAKYFAFLVKGDSETRIKLGSINRGNLDVKLLYGRQDFWYQVHRALCLARVDHGTYEKTLQMLDTWVALPPQDEFINLIQKKQSWAEQSQRFEEQAIMRKLARIGKRGQDVLDVRGIGSKHLDAMQRSASNVSL